MRFEDEIIRAVKHIAGTDTTSSAIHTDDQIADVVRMVQSSLLTSTYDFSKSESIVLNQSGKKRFIKRFPEIYSPENILCQYIKQILDRTFKIRYPNRNQSIRGLFDILKAVRQMADFTVIKYDFKDYFNSVSATYVFEKYLKDALANRHEVDLLKNFVEQTRFTYAGLSTSNVIAEIAAQKFDQTVRILLAKKGVLFFERYIDDTIIVINEHLDKSYFQSLIDHALKTVFFDNSVHTLPRCKTRLNTAKYSYLSNRLLQPNNSEALDFLGYEFIFTKANDNKTSLSFGLTKIKRDKYEKNIDAIIHLYTHRTLPSGSPNPDYQRMELLRHRIAAFTSRTVYQRTRFSSTIWKVRGFIANYGELRHLLGTGFIDKQSEIFLKKMVENAFQRAGVELPYFLYNKNDQAGYNLYENMKKNKTILLIEGIGYSKRSLQRLCTEIDIQPEDNKNLSYRQLVRLCLIKLKVGY
jgi:hypothetical protein